MIRLEHVTKTYKGENAALRDASADIQKGEFVFLVGPSGSGKSTFIRLLNKEETPELGRIFVAGKDIGELSSWKVPFLRRNIGCVFQDFKLLPNKTVYQNVAFALEVIGRPKHVVSTTLSDPSWHNTSVIAGDTVAQAIQLAARGVRHADCAHVDHETDAEARRHNARAFCEDYEGSGRRQDRQEPCCDRLHGLPLHRWKHGQRGR